MPEIRHGTHWGVWQCQRRPEGSCQECRDFRAEYQRQLRATKRERRLKRAAARIAAERPAPAEPDDECVPYCWCRNVDGHISTAMRWVPGDPIPRFVAENSKRAAAA